MDRLDAVDERRYDRALERREEVGHLGVEGLGHDRPAVDAALLELAQHRGLEPRKGEVVRPVARPADRERVTVPVAPRRDAVDDGSTRIAEARSPRDLVEGLAGRVVARSRERRDAVFFDADELSVAAGDDEPVEGLFD